jgi:hypothetical protein
MGDKKGIGIQFNWIFVIISGAIILAFFSLFVFKYIDLQVAKEDVQISRLLSDTVLALEGASSGGGFVIPAYSDGAFKIGVYANVNYTCARDEVSFTINDEPLSKQTLLDEVVFAPDRMYVNAINTWIYPWDYPYFNSNFIYLSPKEKRFFIYYDSSTEEYVQELALVDDFIVQEAFNVELIRSDDAIEGDDVKLVWFGAKPSNQKIKDWNKEFESFEIIQVNPVTNKVAFYENGWKEEHYWGDALLFGAVFSDSYEIYSCGYERSLKRLNSVTRVINGRVDLISRDETSEGCSTAYSSLQNVLTDFGNNPNEELMNEVIRGNDNLVGKGCNFAF